MAVIIAALLAAWLNSPWPDLIVASCIAVLFIHSSVEIIRTSSVELLIGR